MGLGTTLVDILSGFCAGIGVTVVGHPFETVKVRLQTQPSGPNAIYKGFVDCVVKTVKWEGPQGLYKGVSAPLLGQLFFRSSMFWVNGTCVRWLGDGGRRKISYLEYALGGSLTWAVCTVIECPLQLASSQMQVQIVRLKADPSFKPEFAGVLSYYSKAPSKYGLRALYTGIVPHLCRNSVGGFFHFGAFELLRREWAARQGVAVADVGLTANMIAGSVGGVLFWTLSYPFDLVKSAMQVDSLSSDPTQRKYHNMSDAFRKLWAEGGVERFSRGFTACLLRSVPANAVLLTTAFRVKEIGYAWLEDTGRR